MNQGIDAAYDTLYLDDTVSSAKLTWDLDAMATGFRCEGSQSALDSDLWYTLAIVDPQS